MAMLETLVQLFAAFAKIGFTSFGGTSMIPLIMDEMSSHGWMTDADLTNLIAIAEMTPALWASMPPPLQAPRPPGCRAASSRSWASSAPP